MSERGVFAVDRGIWVDPDFAPEPFTEREAWMWLVGAAAWKTAKARGNTGQPIELKRGEFSFSVRFLAERWMWETTRVHRFLKMLEKRNTVSNTKRNGAGVYFIRNYNKFQIVGLPRATADAAGLATEVQQKRNKEEEGKHLNKETESLRDSVLEIDDAQIAFDLWNEVAKRLSLPRADDLSKARRGKLSAMLKRHGPEGWRRALTRLEASPHCLGDNDRGWKATIDFLLRPDKLTALLEGAYAGNLRPANSRGPPSRQRTLGDVLNDAEAFLNRQKSDDPPDRFDLSPQIH